MKILVISTVAIPAMFLLGQGGPPTCLRYEPDIVRVSGTLARHTYYGAPGFGEDPKHDQKEVGFYVDLAAPICMAPGSDDVDVAKSGIRRIQLVLDEHGYARLRPLLGKRITLRGTLFGAITGHHHTPVLLRVVTPGHAERPRRHNARFQPGSGQEFAAPAAASARIPSRPHMKSGPRA